MAIPDESAHRWQQPFYGVFYDKQGNEHDLTELIGGASADLSGYALKADVDATFVDVYKDITTNENEIDAIKAGRAISETEVATGESYGDSAIYRRMWEFTTLSTDGQILQIDMGVKTTGMVRTFGNVVKSDGTPVMILWTEIDFDSFGVQVMKLQGYFSTDSTTGNTVVNIISYGFGNLPGKFWLEYTKD